MPSTKLVQILRSKGAPFTDDELERMSDRDAWAWIYTHDAANRRPKDARLEVCLTGFATDEKDGMAAIALTRMGLIIAKSGHLRPVLQHAYGIISANYAMEDGRIADLRGQIAEKLNEQTKKNKS